MKLKGKRILLGVSGSIAAYKALLLTRLLVVKGAEVQVIMTKAATSFVGPLSFSTLSKKQVLTNYFDHNTGEWSNHVELGLWPDLIIIAPATANTISKLAHGNCDDLLQAVYLSARCPVLIAPAMDLEMYQHPSFLNNLKILRSHGILIQDAGSGELASGLSGKGRMSEPEEILNRIEKILTKQASLHGKKVLVNAGPTYEKIDPIRFVGNRSTGKMGSAIANELIKRGAAVHLVLGPSHGLEIADGIDVSHVESAAEMYDACLSHWNECDAAVLSAAVADYTSNQVVTEKIKKKAGPMILELSRTKDILAELGQNKGDRYLVGFAMETQNELESARKKLDTKNADLIVLNSLRDEGAGFGHDTNKVTLIHRNGQNTALDLKSKKQVAIDIVDAIEKALLS